MIFFMVDFISNLETIKNLILFNSLELEGFNKTFNTNFKSSSNTLYFTKFEIIDPKTNKNIVRKNCNGLIGIYVFETLDNEILYIGKTTYNLYSRVSSYWAKSSRLKIERPSIEYFQNHCFENIKLTLFMLKLDNLDPATINLIKNEIGKIEVKLIK